MKPCSIWIALLMLASCESSNYAPPVNQSMAKFGAKQDIDLATLQKGRALFVHRCIECHALPIVWHYRKDDWPEIVDSMSQRSSLKPHERDALVAYILAVRAQP